MQVMSTSDRKLHKTRMTVVKTPQYTWSGHQEAKSVKMDRYEKMVNATQLLVASDESQAPGASKSLAGDPGQ